MALHPDEAMMARALRLAENGLYTTTPNPRVGCVIVNADGQILGEGWTQPAGQNHAEIQALLDAQTRGFEVRGATAYVTLEPCSHYGRTPPCCNALIEAGIRRVIAAMEDPNPLVAGKGFQLLAAAGIEVRQGVLSEPAEALNAGFLSRIRRGRPFVRLKIAASLDGKTALSNGESKWITSAAARADAHHWRARSCAILTGIGTVLADDPAMTVREVKTPRQPKRVILDSRLRIPTSAAILDPQAERLVIHTALNPQKEQALRDAGASLLAFPGHAEVPLIEVLEYLGKNGCNELLVEAGARLNASFIHQQLVDEYLIYQAPVLLGDSGRGMACLPEAASIAGAPRLRFIECKSIGEDLRILARPALAPQEPSRRSTNSA